MKICANKVPIANINRAKAFAKSKEDKYGIKYRPYKCPECYFFHLTTKNTNKKHRAKNTNKKHRGSKGNKLVRQRSKRRSNYRINKLPVETWESEGGYIPDVS
jgi:hypothetical protein